MGDQAELDFQALCQRRGWPCRRATKREDREEHWDFLVQRQRPLRVEVKAAKRLKRSDPKPSSEYTWLEWIGVPRPDGSENLGWVRGSADWIAFQTGKSFLMVKRSEAEKLLISFSHAKHCRDFDQPPWHQLYERWTDGQLRGIMLLVKLSELRALDQSFVIN